MERIVIENIPISFTRKNIKNINLRIVSPSGEVRVSAPMFENMKRVEKFIAERKDWILASQRKVIERSNSKNNYTNQLFENCSSEKEIKQQKKWCAQELIEQSKPYFEKWKNITGLTI